MAIYDHELGQSAGRLNGYEMFGLNRELNENVQDSADGDLLASEEQPRTYNPFQSLGANDRQSRQSEEGRLAPKGLYSGVVT